MTDEKANFLSEYRTAIILTVLGTLVAVLYFQTSGHSFINFDDNLYVYENRAVTSGLSLNSVRWAFTTFHAANWHPLTWLSLMLDAQLFGPAAGAFHLVNVLLHLICTLLAFLVFHRMTGHLWPSAVIAALFAAHPTHVESVAWVAERKDVLSTLFWFLSMWLYIRWYRTGAKANNAAYFASLGAFAAGLAAKPMVVTLPFILILCDIWPLARIDGRVLGEYYRLIKEKIPFFVLAAASSVITVIAQRFGGATISLERTPILLRIENSILSYAKYVIMAVWPLNLGVQYPYDRDLSLTEVAAAAVLLIVITCICIWQFKARKYLLIGWLWFIGTLVPVIGIVQVGGQSMADRYTYIPYFGLFIMAVFGVAEFVSAFRVNRQVVTVFAVLLISVYSIFSYVQIGYWIGPEKLYLHTLAHTENNYLIAQNLCMHYLVEGRVDEAEALCQKSLSFKPDYSLARNSMGLIMFARHDLAGAESEFAQAVQLSPDKAGFYSSLALAQILQGKTEESEANMAIASGLVEQQSPPPQYLSALRELAAAQVKNGNFPKAADNYSRLLTLVPSDIDSRGSLADSLYRIGRNDEALRQIQIYVANRPNDADARNLFGAILLRAGNRAAAIVQFEAALKINPEHTDARNNLYQTKGGGS